MIPIDPVTLGGSLFGIKQLINSIIDNVGDEFKDIISLFKDDAIELIEDLEEKYQDNLNITLDALGTAIKNSLNDLEQTFYEINETLKGDIEWTSNIVTNLLKEVRINISKTVDDVEKRLNKVIITAGETGAFLIDRFTYNTILIVSLIMIAIGLIVFTTILAKYGIPSGVAGILMMTFMGIILIAFGLLIVPNIRISIMKYTGIGLKEILKDTDTQPQILDTEPSPVILTTTKNLKIIGTNLKQAEKDIKVMIDGKNMPVTNCDSERIVVDISEFYKEADYCTLSVLYDGKEGASKVIEIKKPELPKKLPDLFINRFIIDPPEPLTHEYVKFKVVVQNKGEGPIEKPFNVKLSHKKTTESAEDGWTISRLDAGATTPEHSWKVVFNTAGKYQATVIIDPEEVIEEMSINKDDNSKTLDFEVLDPPKIIVYADENFNGSEKEITKNIPDLKSDGWSGRISSIKVHGNASARAYREEGFKGDRSLYIYEDFDAAYLKEHGFHDSIKSIKFYNHKLDGITIYKGKNFTGESTFLTNSISNLHEIDFGDNVKSIKIHGNVKIVIYQDKAWDGAHKTITNDIFETDRIHFGDISSIKFEN